MVMINCSECGREIPVDVTKCPNCGSIVEKQSEIHPKKQNNIKKLLMIIIAIIIIAIIMCLIKKSNDEKAQLAVFSIVSANHEIEEHKKMALIKTENGNYIFDEEGAQKAIEKISTEIFVICKFANDIDKYYPKSRNAINKKVQEETNYNFFSWEEYREHLDLYFYIDEDISSDDKAEKFVEEYVNTMLD